MRGIVMLVVAGTLLVGCAHGGGARERTDPDYISREEIMSVDARSLFDVVNRLRPRWVNAARRAGERSFGLSTEVVVYQEQMFLGDIDTLRNWSPSAAYGMKWLDASTASATLPGLGSRHVAGAIVIYTSPPQ